MKERWLVVFVGLPLLLAVLLACPVWATILLVCAIAGVAAYELLHVTGKNATKPVYVFTILCAAAQVVVVYQYAFGTRLDTFPANGAVTVTELMFFPMLLTVILFFLAVISYGKKNAIPFSTVAAGIVGGVVFPMMFSCIGVLRCCEPFGRFYVLAPFAVAFVGDALALYFGLWFGNKKMAPHVSPHKTWAGFCGSILGSVLGLIIIAVICSRWLGYVPDYARLALAAAAANLLGQLGDLSMSLIKREAGIKDYSRLFLEHGGVLDRFDSTLFIAPAIYFFVTIGII